MEKRTTDKKADASRMKPEPSGNRRNIERGVEDIFRKFENEPEVIHRRQEIIDDSIDIQIEIAEKDIETPKVEKDIRKPKTEKDVRKPKTEKDVRKPKPQKKQIRKFRPLYATGAVLMLVTALAFFMIKPQQAPVPDKPAVIKRLHKIVPPVPKPRIQLREEQAAQPVTEDIRKPEEIKAFLMEWKTAWENTAGKQGDMETFMSFYSDTFNSKNMSKNQWRNDKALKNSLKEWIRLELKNILIAEPDSDDRAQVSFLLNYRSSNYSDETYQTLILKKKVDNWKIIEIKAANK